MNLLPETWKSKNSKPQYVIKQSENTVETVYQSGGTSWNTENLKILLCCDLIQNKKFVKVLWLLQRRDILPLQKSAALGLSVLHKLSYMV